MAGNKSSGRKTGKVVRMPATKFAHLRKQLTKGPARTKQKTKRAK